MNIGLVSHLNPREIKSFLCEDQDIPDTGVSVSSVHAYITGLLYLGHHLTVFSPVSQSLIGYRTKILRGDGITIIMVPVLTKIDFLIRDKYLPQLLARQIARYVKGLDVLHAQWTYENAMATVGFADKIPTFCSVRDWWPVQNGYFEKSGGRILRYYWGHTMKRMFFKIMEQKNIHFIANSEYTRGLINDMYPHYNVPIIPNPLKKKYIIEDKAYSFNNVFISISSNLNEKRKNYGTLLKAFSDYHNCYNNNAKLLLVGSYSVDDPEFQMWLNNGWLDNVELCGSLSLDEVIAKIDEATVLIHPSLEETFGNILLEGMSRRVLVIGGKMSGAVPSVLGEGKYGLLCDMTKAEDILMAMNSVASAPQQFVNIIEAATEHLLEDLTDEAVAKKHIKLYMKFLSN